MDLKIKPTAEKQEASNSLYTFKNCDHRVKKRDKTGSASLLDRILLIENWHY